MGFADLLATDATRLTSEQRDAVENILRASRRASDLVRGLGQLARPGSQHGESFDLAAVVDEVCGVLRETTERIVAKEEHVARGLHFLRGSSSDLYHALMNLGVNAVQAVLERDPPGGGWVRFEASEEAPRPPGSQSPAAGRWVHLSVADSGAGMTPEVRRRAFDPLFSTKDKASRGGQGLGLTMVYNIVVRQFGGLIDVVTAPGAGTTFHLYLPRAEPPEAPQPAATESSAHQTSSKATVLVVDDEPHVVHLARRVLEPEGHRVLTATTGVEALEICDRWATAIDLVIMDQNMPHLSGEEAMARLRISHPNLKVIISTGGGAVDAPAATGLLPKPYTASELREKVRETLARP
jgi:CheY-like chemotaxis protein